MGRGLREDNADRYVVVGEGGDYVGELDGGYGAGGAEEEVRSCGLDWEREIGGYGINDCG